jgi:hypothetical protein
MPPCRAGGLDSFSTRTFGVGSTPSASGVSSSIGFSLTAEGLGFHVEKTYIYAAMGFSVFVELLNLRIRGSHRPVHLRTLDEEDGPPEGGAGGGVGEPGVA